MPEPVAAEIRRSSKGTVSGLLSLGLFTAAGVLLLANEYTALRPSYLMAALGVALLLWAGVIAQGLRRPVLMSAGPDGVQVRRLSGQNHFRWQDLRFANFDGSPRAVVLGGLIGGNMRYAAFAKRGATAEHIALMKQVFAQYRPDLPETLAPPPADPAKVEETEGTSP